MKIAMMLGTTKKEAEFARQAGLRDVVWSAAGSDKGYVTYEELQDAREFFQSYGLELGVIENVAFVVRNLPSAVAHGLDREHAVERPGNLVDAVAGLLHIACPLDAAIGR